MHVGVSIKFHFRAMLISVQDTTGLFSDVLSEINVSSLAIQFPQVFEQTVLAFHTKSVNTPCLTLSKAIRFGPISLLC